MKKRQILLMLVSLTLIVGMVLAGCDNGTTDSGGGSGGTGNTTTYTVNYDVGDGSGTAPSSQTVSKGTVIYLPGQGSMTAPSGKNFTGWRSSGQDYSTGNSYTVNNNVTFIAQWGAGGTGGTGDTGGTGGTGGTSIPSAPTVVTATALSASSISVSWSSVTGATSYDVYYEIGASSTKNFASNVTGTSYTHTGLSSGTTYYYYIKAKNSAGSSDYSSYGYATTESVAGSSYANAITIASGNTTGSFPSGLDTVWYKFTKNGSGFLAAGDRDYSTSYSGDIVIDVFSSSLGSMTGPVYQGGTFSYNGSWENIDVGGGAYGTTLYAANWSGTYYVKVRPYNNNSANKGTFALVIP